MKTNRLSKASLLLLLWAWGACCLFAQSTLQVVWENSESELLLDSAGNLLPAGAASNGDGCVLQLGYYSNATALNPFAGDFVALTGEGSINTLYANTSVGDSGGQSPGRFSVSTTFQSGAAVSGQNLPAPGTPLSIRFFNSSTIATSTTYNAVSGGARWAWKAPATLQGELLLLSLGDEGVVWLGGPASALRATLPSALRFDSQPLSIILNPNGTSTLSVGISGILPATFQWRKNGSAISGANSASYTLSNVQVGDAGSYDVVVTNLAGSATSGTAIVSVNTPPSFVSQPSELSLNSGSLATFSVSVAGTGPFSYQWRKDGIPLAGGTLATYSIVTRLDTEGSYDVLVSNVVNSITSVPARLSILRLPTLSQTINDFRMLKGSLATLSLAVESQIPESSDTWQLFQAGANLPILSGTVASGGGFVVPLRYLSTAGDYFIRTSRSYSNGSPTAVSDSAPFHVELFLWDSIAGAYEALLTDSTHIPNDGAVYRGVLGFSVTRYGYASGRLRYNEPLPIVNAPDPALRNYTPVLRTFVTAFTPVAGNPSLLQAIPRLGTGIAAGREELLLQLDLTTSPPTFSATVKNSSLVVPDGGLINATSIATECARQITSLLAIPTSMRGAFGHYTLAADSSNLATDKAHLFLTVTSYGNLLWLTRRPGYTGSGSTSLSIESENSFGARIYEAQTTVVRAIGSILMRSWLGKIHLVKTDLGSWRARVDAVMNTRSLELQSCCLTNTAGLISYKSENTNWSKIQGINFSEGIGSFWSYQSNAVSLLTPPSRKLFHLQHPLGNPSIQPGDSFWNVAFSITGWAAFDRMISGGATFGTMLGQLARSTGAWEGYYFPPTGSLRYRVYGVVHDPLDTPPEMARGWVESGYAPFLSVGTWTMESASAP